MNIVKNIKSLDEIHDSLFPLKRKQLIFKQKLTAEDENLRAKY